ncbi:dethiobiotin synthase [Leekyejoonella antrihumi]|uniref:ATP-dependent dethiobiotin synthetase BioD n=1 Tax=Leekyejoonella antrihumi TaxID=1660198 RepID=A0A563E6L6_9MICO|nr:dethiobiotin synthase [Leekyejoonella antrihumi]TWP37903.1 ATP-dependent dethiobiotin synthetase BioD [Leekyejoonella antrihumi]
MTSTPPSRPTDPVTPCPIMCVTGTSTEVGKTVVTAALAAALHARHQRVAVVKPAQTGLQPGEPGDMAEVTRLAGPGIATFENVRLPDPLAPDVAARRAGLSIPTVAEHAASVGTLARSDNYDVVLVEGSGGLLVHLDSEGGDLTSIAAALGAGELRVGFVVVVQEGLGTLNHTALTLEALAHRGLDLLGVVVGSQSPTPDLAAKTNVEELSDLAGGFLIGGVPAGAAQLDPAQFQSLAEGWVHL